VIYVLGQVENDDLGKFITVFATRSHALRRQHGAQGSRVFKVLDTSDRIVVLMAWASREAFEGFLNDPAVREAMRSGGTTKPPQFTYRELVGELPS